MLTHGKAYEVLQEKHHHYQVVDDSGDTYYYFAGGFTVLEDYSANDTGEIYNDEDE